MLVRAFLILLLLPSLSFAANYYVDPTYDGSNGYPNGSFLRPWTNMAGQVRAHSFSTGDRLYFRSGTVTPMNTHLIVNWHGTAQNRVIIGTYFGEDDFGNGNVHPSERAVLDGQNFLVPTDDNWAMIQSTNNPGYITIQDLEIRDSGAHGITLGNTYVSGNINDYPYLNQYYIVRNNYINRPWRAASSIGRSSHNQYLNNTVEESSYGHWRTHPHRGTRKIVGGAAIEFTGMYIYGTSKYNVVAGNTISRAAYEGIGFYKRSSHGTVTNNIVYDCSVNIYIDGSSDIDVYNNIIYGTRNARRGQTAAGYNNVRNILLQHEFMDEAYGTPHPPRHSRIENVRVFNNYVAGGALGIGVQVYAGDLEYGWKNVEIFNNIVVDNQHNFRFVNIDPDLWADNYIYGNYSFQYETTDGQHTRINSPNSFQWNRDKNNTPVPNHFIGNNMPAGNAGQGASFNTAHLANKTSWRFLSPGEVTIDDFAFEGDKKIMKPEKVNNFKIIEAKDTN